MPINSLGMRLRTILNQTISLLALAACAARAGAQEDPPKRLANIVGVAVEEYAKGIDAQGRLISAQEYSETLGFLQDARSVAERLSGDRAPAVRAVLDTLVAAVQGKVAPARLTVIHARFVAAMGADAALDLPPGPIDLAEGQRVYETNCVACHGERGLGDGPDAAAIHPRPPAIGRAATLADATPALLFRVLSVGVAGTQMPAWGSKLTAQQRWEVVSYVQSMHSTPGERLEGEGLFVQRCASCHGALGALNGPDTRALTKLPPDVGSLEWQAERSDAQLAAMIRTGMPGTAMPPAPGLSDADVAKIVAYVRSLPARRRDVPVQLATADTSASDAARTVLAALDQSLAAAQAGRPSEAGDRAFDAYLAFEPLEGPARA